jgi:NitT/TauT family transport system ATP-binding protein
MAYARDAICEARNVSVAFGDPPRLVLADVTLAANEGEVLALLGPSGCGKSTLLRAMVGLLKPTRGEVFAHGKPLEGVHPGVALVFQNFALFPWMTVAQNIAVGLNGVNVSPEVARRRIANTIETVGLAGYEHAYPKELSGGMKQRVGIGRALARGPELLCMDEPFSALDVFTAESLRSEVYRLWSEPKLKGKMGAKGGGGGGAGSGGVAVRQSSPQATMQAASGSSAGAAVVDETVMPPLRSVMIITHIIEEAVFLADRIVIMGTRPGHIRQVIDNHLEHPRDYQSPAFLEMVQQLHDIIVSEHLPDRAPVSGAAANAAPSPEPLPPFQLGQMFGLMEILRDRGGSADVFSLNAVTDYDFGHTLSVIKGGEMLGFLNTPRNMVQLTPLGNRLLDAEIGVRKDMLNAQLRTLGTFRFMIDLIQESPRKMLSKELALEELAVRLPTEDVEKLFTTIIAWGRFAELFDYSMEGEEVTMAEGEKS